MIKFAKTRDDLSAIEMESHAVIYVSVEWSLPERHSRSVFTQFADLIDREYSSIGISFWIVHEEWECIGEWFSLVMPPTSVASGYGAIVWLERGHLLASEENAANAGLQGLVNRTLGLWLLSAD
jgi:hypothetical protein